MEHNVLVTSVGGQGGMTLAKVIAEAALASRLNVRVGETLGMSQRGGPVQSHVRIGERVTGSVIPRGRCDVLLSLEPGEAVRMPEYLGPETKAIVATTPVYPIPVMLGEAKYPELSTVVVALEKIGCKVYTLDAAAIALGADAAGSLNMVVLGAYAVIDGGVLTPESLRTALGEALPKRFLEANTRAFDAGYDAIRKGLGE